MYIHTVHRAPPTTHSVYTHTHTPDPSYTYVSTIYTPIDNRSMHAATGACEKFGSLAWSIAHERLVTRRSTLHYSNLYQKKGAACTVSTTFILHKKKKRERKEERWERKKKAAADFWLLAAPLLRCCAPFFFLIVNILYIYIYAVKQKSMAFVSPPRPCRRAHDD